MSGENKRFSDLTAREYAAILLGSPTSGTPWLDKMIEDSRKSTEKTMTSAMTQGMFLGHRAAVSGGGTG